MAKKIRVKQEKSLQAPFEKLKYPIFLRQSSIFSDELLNHKINEKEIIYTAFISPTQAEEIRVSQINDKMFFDSIKIDRTIIKEPLNNCYDISILTDKEEDKPNFKRKFITIKQFTELKTYFESQLSLISLIRDKK